MEALFSGPTSRTYFIKILLMRVTYTLKAFQDLSLEELYEILQIRQRVFVLEQECSYLDCDGKDYHSHHLIGRDEKQKIVTYSRLLPPDVSYPGDASIGRVLSDAALRGSGEGKRLMQESIQMCYQLYGKVSIRISGQCYLRGFYGSLGFVEVGEEYFEDDIPHIEMVLTPGRDAQ